MSDWLTSNSMLMLERSMNYLWTNQTAMLDNITNAETPGYKTKTVNFEDSFKSRLQAAALRVGNKNKNLRSVIASSEPIVSVADKESSRLDGNGVNIAEQQVELVRNAFQMQYLLSSINSDFSILRTAIKG